MLLFIPVVNGVGRLTERDGETYAIEPHPSGGLPIVSTNDPQNRMNTYYINDILGTTLAVVHPDRIEIVPLTAFGRPLCCATGPSKMNKTRAVRAICRA